MSITPHRLPGLRLYRQGEEVHFVEGAVGDEFSCQQRIIPKQAEDCLPPNEACNRAAELAKKVPYPLPLPPDSPIFFSQTTYIDIQHFSRKGDYSSSPEYCTGPANYSYQTYQYYLRWTYASAGWSIALETTPSGTTGRSLTLRLRDTLGRVRFAEGVLYQSSSSNPNCSASSTIFDHVVLTIEDYVVPPFFEKPDDPGLEERLKKACAEGKSIRPNGQSCEQFKVEVDIYRNGAIADTFADGITWQEDLTPPIYNCEPIAEQLCPPGQILCGNLETGCCFSCSPAAQQIAQISKNIQMMNEIL